MNRISFFSIFFSKLYEKVVIFVFFWLLAREFGPAVLGEFSYIFSIASFAFIIIDLGGENYQIKKVSQEAKRGAIFVVMLLKTVLFVSFFPLIITYGNTYLFILISAFYLESIANLFRAINYVEQKYLKESILSIVEKSIFMIFCILSFEYINDLMYVCLSYVAGRLVYIALALKFVYVPRVNFTSVKYIYRYVFYANPFMFHSLIMVAIVQSDLMILKFLNIEFSEIGLYVAAVKLYMVFLVLAEVINKYFYPKVISILRQGNKLQMILEVCKRISLVSILVVAPFLIMFKSYLVEFVFGPDFISSVELLEFLMLVVVFRFLLIGNSILITSSKYNSIKVYFSFIILLVNVGINLLLIPDYGIWGAVIATIISEFLMLLLFRVYCYRMFNYEILGRDELAVLVFVIALILLSYFHNFKVYEQCFVFILALVLSITYYFNSIGRVFESTQ